MDEAFDIIHHVNDYYQDAWDKLITTLVICSIVSALLKQTVMMDIFIQYYGP